MQSREGQFDSSVTRH
nr:unnamed protein product [Callosobruchus chinensis]CAH7730142.1 unnamed protein product [Callosobruchus chinensis]